MSRENAPSASKTNRKGLDQALQVMELHDLGHSNAEIAQKLGMTEAQVESYFMVRHNPNPTTMDKTLAFASGGVTTLVVDALLNKYADRNGNYYKKRHIVSGVCVSMVGVGAYGLTDNEEYLWATAGSIVGIGLAYLIE
jgi:acyl dehydratase